MFFEWRSQEKEYAENGKHYEELYEDDGPQRLADRHPPEAFIIEEEYFTQFLHIFALLSLYNCFGKDTIPSTGEQLQISIQW